VDPRSAATGAHSGSGSAESGSSGSAGPAVSAISGISGRRVPPEPLRGPRLLARPG
jgi:hypothetical protein